MLLSRPLKPLPVSDFPRHFPSFRAFRHRGLAFCVAAGAALGAAGAGAQQTDIEDVIVTAARVPQSAQDVVPDTTVLTREDIEREHATDLVELLGRQAGIEFAQLGGAGRQASVFMRGANSNQVLVLVDGVPLNSVLDGAAAFGRITTDFVERIEIVRGNLSSLYGSAAVGGVIQIFTRGADHPGAQAQVELGERDTRSASAGVAAPLGRGVSLAASAGWREENAISAIDASQVRVNPSSFVLGANPAADPARNSDGSVSLKYRGEADELSGWVWGSRSDTTFDSPYDGPTADHIEHGTLAAWGLSGQHRFANGSSLRLNAGQTRDTSVDDYLAHSAADAPTSFVSGRFESRSRQASLEGDVKLGGNFDLLAGGSRLDQAGGTTQFDPSFAGLQFTSFERRVDSLWLGMLGKLAGQNLQLNVRHDQFSDFGGTTTGLAGWGVALARDLRLAAQFSSAFRAPSFDDLYSPFGGNKNLRPERARTQEIGLRWARGLVNASANVYRTRTDGLIVFDPVTFIPNNIGRAAIDGAELQGQGRLGAWSLGASVGMLHARDADTGLPLMRRARYVARVQADWTSDAWRVAGQWSRSGARDDFDINTNLRTQLAPYSLARLVVERRLWREVKVHVRVENLFNAHYQLVDGYNTLPRLVVGGIEARM